MPFFIKSFDYSPPEVGRAGDNHLLLAKTDSRTVLCLHMHTFFTKKA